MITDNETGEFCLKCSSSNIGCLDCANEGKPTREDAQTILSFFRRNGIVPFPVEAQPHDTMFYRLMLLAGEFEK